MRRVASQFSALSRAFFARFFESELTSTLGWWMVARAGGVNALRQMAATDKTLYLGYAMALAALLTSLNCTIDAVDAAAAMIILAPIVVAAAVATYLPARRAARTDPIAALKDS